MNRATALRRALLATFAFSIVWAASPAAYASHFRGGNIYLTGGSTVGPPTSYPDGIIDIELVALSLTSADPLGQSVPLPPPGQTYQVDSFFDVFTELSIGGQPYAIDSFFDITYRVSPGSSPGTFDTEMLSMSLMGQAPGGPQVRIRESPSRPSLGRISISDLPGGGFHVDSFFDVFTELSIDGGPFVPADRSTHLRLRGGVPEPGTMTLALLSSLAFIRRHRSRQEAAVGEG